jgi:Fatty acid desaturase
VTSATTPGHAAATAGPGPMIVARPKGRNAVVKLFVFVPFLALLAASPIARSRPPDQCGSGWPSWAAWPSKGPVITWVADHRRHHAFTDKQGDPHSPWLFGTGPAAIAKGFWHSHFGWMLDHDLTNPARFAPDLLADPDIARVNRQFPLWSALSLLAPAALGGLLTWSWWGAVTAFFWAGLVRIGVLHHVTWSVNSICHMIGTRPLRYVTAPAVTRLTCLADSTRACGGTLRCKASTARASLPAPDEQGERLDDHSGPAAQRGRSGRLRP